eukprot:CAMPEP_0185611070 /NCGR_PEP_ID=MMETSP0436-20130131/14341_1 /TAXON_ID=626734 ORGANISM="Favella taraikaensis, Strain Fe Narragansett Bay" /NCGR_SAMPLE_ID=MMETSP0436 /ASSEMBLY_ACC=CAM_ASM_000390 /LENGTH=52 /DNA_ID=CAMNT_0028243851 /DNA_START=357 /DNA_END=515 /DNA_ORIENTATION=-
MHVANRGRLMALALRLLHGDIASMGREERVRLLALLDLLVLRLTKTAITLRA